MSHEIKPLAEYKKRRKKLMSRMGKDSVALLATSPLSLRSRDIYYPYRPNSDFYYLTGLSEPSCVIVLIPGRPEGEYILFCPAADPVRVLWDGPHIDPEQAKSEYEADEAFDIKRINQLLPELLKNKNRLFYTMGEDSHFDQQVIDCMNNLRSHQRSGIHEPFEVISLTHLIHEMRLYKSKHEIRKMRRAARLSASALAQAMRICQPGLTEYQLEAEILYYYMKNGARAPAYPLIVGGGSNGCVLHYTQNASPLEDGDLVLIDAGAELGFYASDITRTFPINGRFNDRQRAVYEVVLAAQQAAIDEVQVGKHWNQPHERACEVLTEGLIDLGILQGTVTECINDKSYQPYYMHRTGHWLGMDVHDVGDYRIDGVWRELEPGMVLTVEPGLYLRAGIPGLDEKWWNIGIRIEDDVLVSHDGPEVLSRDAPKTISEIETVMADL